MFHSKSSDSIVMIIGASAILWTLLNIISVWNAIGIEKKTTEETVVNIARANFNKDLAYRKWATDHGGVYVTPTEKTPPSPWMGHLPKRDVVTTDGEDLTLMNPAYMLREMMDHYSDLYGIKGRIFGKLYLNPNNKANAFEETALDKFKQDNVKEIVSFMGKGDNEYLYLSQPMYMEQKCQKCHGEFGLENGSIRGGISVSVPMREYRIQENLVIKNIVYTYVIIWLIGLFGIFLAFKYINRVHNNLKRTIEKLNTANKNLQIHSEAFDASTALCYTDAKGRITYVNESFSKLTGYSNDELVGNTHAVMRSRNTTKETIKGLWNTIVKGKIWRGTVENIKKDGKPIFIDVTIVPMYVDNKISEYFSINYDLTDERENQQYLNEKIKRGVDKIREKDAIMLKQSRLAAMGELISMIAHQWRQPLGTISSNLIDMKLKSELQFYDLKDINDALEYEKYINYNIDNTNSMVQTLSTTIDDFRNFYSSDKEIVSQSFDMVCDKTLKIIGKSLENDNIEIKFNYISLEKHKICENEFIHVILNILKNAQDNFKEKEVENKVIVITADASNLSICDNGGGISDDIIDRIFDPYFSTKKEKNGTGLGLYMSKNIIEEHHKGELNVRNIDDGVCLEIKLKSD